MERMLQWVDEIDDAIAVLRQWWLGAAPTIDLPAAAVTKLRDMVHVRR